MTLQQDFEGILSRYGHDILLLHSDKKTTCTCYDPKTGSTNSSCPFCFGMGTIPLITKERVREQDMRVPETIPYLATQQIFGEMAIPTRAYFMQASTTASAHDLILDVDWNGTQPVYTGRGLYEIAHVDSKRFENGEFVFRKVYVKDNPIQKSIRAIHIIERAGQVFYQVEGGVL